MTSLKTPEAETLIEPGGAAEGSNLTRNDVQAAEVAAPRFPEAETSIEPGGAAEGADLTQNGLQAMTGLGVIDVDRQKASLVVMRVEQRQLLMSMHGIGSVIDVEQDGFWRARVALTP